MVLEFVKEREIVRESMSSLTLPSFVPPFPPFLPFPPSLFLQVTALDWEEGASGGGGGYRVRTARGDSFTARFVIMNFGTFTMPKLPAVPGLGSFEVRGDEKKTYFNNTVFC